ncbi:hypothetical protein Oweho_2316 [Owenweeksia hongkongensis DSM 17368]|uniref:Glycosyltransferase RgtA/B/C/D-like domain-containing protein n=1 Tax=Owenweeksia hongkongensis (strain DSM 17368 / CIP 108786 / JCM 12287 / NRRL B-23963 / UST20020801) TaxID=926562 RepID=G8R5L4_OWEHD|nr:glycosyltransferase family 39 protein [Owenweeksia hongkongensis]AEV33288.1 hypothetical protein Oweho_2316 [Owenweeksia hongkongensis DSM 17368]
MKRGAYILLFLILALAAALRFYHVSDIPFTHDEFSAVNRTHFDNFSDLIEKGVEVDFHPAGVQVFLYYWTMLGGEGEVWVKVPFILSGILAVGLLFVLAKKRFGTSTAVVSSTLLATVSYSMYYGQIARPYVSGVFLVLLLFLFWQNIVYEKSQKLRDYIGLAVALALCAYNHHFSAVQAAVIAVSGIFMVEANQRKKYFLALVASLILYAPNLPIFWVQIQKGGVGGADGWLGAPESDFFIHYVKYIFNFSWWVYIPVAILFVASFFGKKGKLGTRGLMVLWFAIPFTIGFAYSHLVNPILQVSVLIFAFPFLLLALFGGLAKMDYKKELVLFVVLASVCVYSTIYQRQYYQLFYNSSYDQIVKETMDLDDAGTLHFINSHPEINAHYEKVYGAKGKYEWIENGYNRESLKEKLNQSTDQYLTYGYVSSADPVLMNIMANYFPYMEREVNYDNGSFYALAKSGKEKLYSSERCRYKEQLRIEHEWIPIFNGNLDELIETTDNVIDGNVIIDSTAGTGELHWVWQATDEQGKVLDWRAEKVDLSKNRNETTTSFFSVRVRDTNVPIKGSKVQIMLWNMGKRKIYMNHACLKIREGNPLLYGLQHELK